MPTIISGVYKNRKRESLTYNEGAGAQPINTIPKWIPIIALLGIGGPRDTNVAVTAYPTFTIRYIIDITYTDD